MYEDRNPKVDFYLDLRFPASDIPRQARELYRLSRVRSIPTTDFRHAKIVALNPNGAPLDLSLSALRGVSPIHLEYLHNMGASASMSLSLMKDAQLWDLISCTHETDPYRSPSKCEPCAN